nr:MAG TPA: hypothetical protein [Bacteriophage sp.]
MRICDGLSGLRGNSFKKLRLTKCRKRDNSGLL